MSDNDTVRCSAEAEDNAVEVAPKQKRAYVMTEARKAAFERCRLKRMENCKQIQNKKKQEKIQAIESKVKTIKESMGTPKPESITEPEPTLTEVKPKAAPAKAAPKKKKKQVVIVEEQSESSESSVELIIKKKEKARPTKKEPVPEAPSWYDSERSHAPHCGAYNTAPQYVFL